MSPANDRYAFPKYPSTLPSSGRPQDTWRPLHTKERVKPGFCPSKNVSERYVLCTGAGIEKDLLSWRNSSVEFFNLSKGCEFMNSHS